MGVTGPLAGIRVLDFTSVVLGPFATQLLGDLGADVIKIETAAGDDTRHIGPARSPGMGAYFAMLNRNKRSVVLNLKQPAGRAALDRLIPTADVVVHNMRLGAAERLGLDYRSLSERNARLIVACATGFRKGSSKQEAPAFDDLIQAMSGAAALNAGPDGAPRYFPSVIADKLTGHVLASMVGMALFHRERTGRGQEIHVPMLETMVSFLLVEHLWGGVFGQQELGYPRMLTPHRRPYRTKDGFICVICLSDAHWARALEAIGRPELVGDPRYATIAARSENVDSLYGVLAEGLLSRSTAEWLEVFRKLDVPSGPVLQLQDLLTDPYLQETGFFSEMHHPADGTVKVPAIPVAFSDSPGAIRRLWPKLGEHTGEVLREAGCSEEEIAAVYGESCAG